MEVLWRRWPVFYQRRNQNRSDMYMLEWQSYIVVLERSIEECSTTLLHIGMTSYPLAVNAALCRIGVFAIVCVRVCVCVCVCVKLSLCSVFVCVCVRERERARARGSRQRDREREKVRGIHQSIKKYTYSFIFQIEAAKFSNKTHIRIHL